MPDLLQLVHQEKGPMASTAEDEKLAFVRQFTETRVRIAIM